MAIDKLEVEQVRVLREDKDLSFSRIAEIMNFSESTAKRRYHSALSMHEGRDKSVGLETLTEFPAVQEVKILVENSLPAASTWPTRFQPLVVTGDAVVTSDYHIPLHDPALINDMFYGARESNVKQLIIAGDYFNMEDFSSFLPHQPEAALEVERTEGVRVMKTALKYFDRIYYSWGNHDFRLVKKLGFKKSFEECMRFMLQELTDEEFSKITFTDLDYLYYYPNGDSRDSDDRWHICHPRNFSSVPLTVSRKLATKYECNVITGHSHHCAMGVAINGRYVCIDAGGFFDKYRTEYIQKSTGHHEWVQGYTSFNQGYPTLYSPVFGNI